MLRFPKLLGQSLLIAAGAIIGNGLVSVGMTLLGFTFTEIMGDLMLVEVAILFVLAGLVDFSSSASAVHFRRAVLGSKQEYSQAAHKEAGRKALALILAGSFLFVTLVAFAIFGIS